MPLYKEEKKHSYMCDMEANWSGAQANEMTPEIAGIIENEEEERMSSPQWAMEGVL